MTPKQERACIANIQSYLDAEWAIENGKPRPFKVCGLCSEFLMSKFRYKDHQCEECPLGAERFYGCNRGEGYSTYLAFWYDNPVSPWNNATIKKLRARRRWLLKKYKEAGLEIDFKLVEP